MRGAEVMDLWVHLMTYPEDLELLEFYLMCKAYFREGRYEGYIVQIIYIIHRHYVYYGHLLNTNNMLIIYCHPPYALFLNIIHSMRTMNFI